MEFARHFREHVIPGLHRACVVHAVCIAAGVDGWTESVVAIRRQAIERGALSLPPGLDTELLDNWIPSTLLQAVIAAEPAVDAQAALADRIAAEFRAWEIATDAAR